MPDVFISYAREDRDHAQLLLARDDGAVILNAQSTNDAVNYGLRLAPAGADR